jgi:hypothetical protein
LIVETAKYLQLRPWNLLLLQGVERIHLDQLLCVVNLTQLGREFNAFIRVIGLHCT